MVREIPQDRSAWIIDVIKEYARTAENSLCNADNEPAFGKPLAGFSRGDDPIYGQIKDDIGDFYWTPFDIFHMTYPLVEVVPEELTVISWVLPQTKKTKRDHAREKKFSCERWARSRLYGEAFNIKLGSRVVAVLGEHGYEAVCPGACTLWTKTISQRHGIASTWSERHVAYASGLGTFGLCDGLITPVGKAVRLGSVVARIQIPPTPRPYKDRHEYCLFYAKGTCGACIKRCPVGAISKDGHDKSICQPYTSIQGREYSIRNFDIDTTPCGLCQTGVPCESKIPGKDSSRVSGSR
ncbi:MAG TPA: 4Fe-4S ferredoxin [Deltaproteobacteria bacterium]|nr:4Fe-4S ferredoxin [Deltaproteobacteria bacterium]